MDIKKYFNDVRKDDYQRDNYDKFLRKVSFDFNLPSIHIAGSNGKGQTATFIASIYQKAGYKVGLFTSPYFKTPCESIVINQVVISEEEFENYVKKYDKYFSKYSLSEFEILTFIALTYFKDKEVDVAIVECGMGGLVDATNIFVPSLSIITSVSVEHTSYLGTSLSEIAMHKAGIIKEEVPILTCDMAEDAFNVISLTAKEYDSKVHLLSLPFKQTLTENGYSFGYRTFENLEINIKSLASIKDACFAIEASEILKDILPVKKSDIYEGLKTASIKCRMTILNKFKTTVVIDGSHNPEAISLLVKDVSNFVLDKHVKIIFSCFKDKNIENMLSSLGLLTSDITLTSFDHPRSRSEEEYFLYLEDYKYDRDYKEAVQNALNENNNGIILICGSLAFAYQVYDDFLKGIFEFKDYEEDIVQE